MGNRVILATVIVGVAIMMFASAMVPAMAQPEPDSHTPACAKIAAAMAKAVAKGFDIVKAAEIVAKVCSKA